MTENNYDKLKDAICELVNIAEDATSREVFEILDNAGVDVIDCLDKLSGYESISTIDEFKALKDAEEQGLLLRLPCKVGDTIYGIYEKYTKCSENEQEFDEYSCQGCECLECDSHKELYVQSQKAYSLDWIVSNLKRFGKTVFLTLEEAEQKLKEMENK